MVCRAQLAQLKEDYPRIAAAGGEVLAFFPSSVRSVEPLAGKLKTPFPLLADKEGAVYELYGVKKASLLSIYRLSALKSAFKAMRGGFLPKRGEGELGRLPATFIVDREGMIRFAHRGTHSGDRVEAKEVISLLEKGFDRERREGEG